MAGSYLAELPLRWRLRNVFGRITAPILFPVRGAAIMDSLDIAKWSAANAAPGSGPILLPGDLTEQITEWNTQADLLLSYFRAALSSQLLLPERRAAIGIPPGSGPDKAMAAAVPRLVRKYPEDRLVTEEQVRDVLGRLRAALLAAPCASAGAGSADLRARHILGGESPTYADVAMAVSLDALRPSGPPYSPPGSPAALGLALGLFAGLQGEYADLLEWQQHMFQSHFPATLQTQSAPQ